MYVVPVAVPVHSVAGKDEPPQEASGIVVVVTVPVLLVTVSQTHGSLDVTDRVEGRSGAAALAAIAIFVVSGAVDVL